MTVSSLQHGSHHSPAFEQTVPDFHSKDQLQGQSQDQPVYPPSLPYPGGPYTSQGPNSDQQLYAQSIPGQQYVASQVIDTQPCQLSAYRVTTRPSDYMIPAILATVCCFCPTGIVAIYYAHMTNKMTIAGKMEGANRSANVAKALIIASVFVGVICLILMAVRQSGIL
ncbi:hypothetical protein DPMN_108165 [Dreissena polymorpha]|uniref:Uncharacterized protein n=1 Tax=Dreissena polymorpha TaxID=45954 RepID=A0A9D4K812_DREPO|nr:hypothetical protein DPMN_108165 [Dreissena polymorpha]